MITIYYYCPDMTRHDERFMADAVMELAKQLKKDSIKLPISVKRLGDDPKLAKEVDGVLATCDYSSNMFSVWSTRIRCLFLKFGLNCAAKLLVYCPSDSPIALVAKREESSAVWGAAISPFGAVYKRNNKVAIWHEALHLLGADDCYVNDNPSQKKPDCNLDGCIMEYAAPESTCENRPFLCGKNIGLLEGLG